MSTFAVIVSSYLGIPKDQAFAPGSDLEWEVTGFFSGCLLHRNDFPFLLFDVLYPCFYFAYTQSQGVERP